MSVLISAALVLFLSMWFRLLLASQVIDGGLKAALSDMSSRRSALVLLKKWLKLS